MLRDWKAIEAEKARLAAMGARIERIRKPQKLGPPKPKAQPPVVLDVYGEDVPERDEPIVRAIADALMADITEGCETARLRSEAAKTARSALTVFRDERGYKGDAV